jgi:hypothetical protein
MDSVNFSHIAIPENYPDYLQVTLGSIKEHPPSSDISRATNHHYVALDCRQYGDTCSGAFWYPPGGFQDWHTNSDNPGKRLYVSWSETGDSGMRWHRDGEVVDDPDQPGWNVRIFSTPQWHMVYANCWRFSVGWKI